MAILGIYDGHDASVAIVKDDGRIIHFEKERFTRIKHDCGTYDNESLESLLKFSEVDISDIELIVHAGPSLHYSHVWESRIDHSIAVKPTEILGESKPTILIPHHLAHGCYGFFTSAFEEAAVITMDGGGDSVSTSDGPRTVFGSMGVFNNDYKPDLEWLDPDIGATWNILSEQLFHAQSFGAGQVMALAGVNEIDFTARTGFSKQDHLAAKDIQHKTEDWFLSKANSVGHKNIVLSGGCALNGASSYALIQSGYQVHVPPAVYDGGLSIGAALYGAHIHLGKARRAYTPDELISCGYSDQQLNQPLPISDIVKSLEAGKVVALAYGQAESGPRALGYRSIIAAPNALNILDRLNTMKGRQLWRPVAPVMLRDEAVDLFNLGDSSAYSYMTSICPAINPQDCKGIHEDGTARVQIPNKPNPLHGILTEYRHVTGGRMILNTSFNCKGESIVNSVEDAWDSAQRLGVDCLAVGGDLHAL